MRISGITIPDKKRLEFALTAIYGIGHATAQRILSEASISFDKKSEELTPDEEARIRQGVESRRIEGELRRDVSGNIKRLKDIQSYRGMRHTKRLPSRGQRTKTNARTLKGVRKTATSGKRKAEKT
ncbi:MAG TPA: 30S ribosomal protein S13 [Candidatus Paceibacterota bacterium]